MFLGNATFLPEPQDKIAHIKAQYYKTDYKAALPAVYPIGGEGHGEKKSSAFPC